MNKHSIIRPKKIIRFPWRIIFFYTLLIFSLPGLSQSYYFDNYGFSGYVATHGYDPSISSMQAIFLASGPHFRKGITVPKFQNIHIYNLMANILELEGVPNDGNLALVRAMLVNE